jgi:glycosyltransferase involved in cell wall biosynthesis
VNIHLLSCILNSHLLMKVKNKSIDLSVLIPVYNGEADILNCLQSIENQNFSNLEYEVLIINDGSTDNTKLIIEKYKADKPHIKIHNQVNKGNSHSRNRLFDLANGTYLFCLDADDYLVPDTLHTVVNLAISNKLDVVSFKSKSTRIKNSKSTFQEDREFQVDIKTGAAFLEYGEIPNVEPWWYLINKNYLKSINIEFEDLIFADLIFTYKLLISARKVCYLPLHVHWYFLSPNSIMRSSDNIANKKMKLANNTYAMIMQFEKFINEYKKRYDFKHVEFKRDYYVFFMLLKYARFETDGKKFDARLNELKNYKIYPIKNHINIANSGKVKEKFLNFIINRPYLLILFQRLNTLK